MSPSESSSSCSTISWIRPERSTRSRKVSLPISRRAITRPATRSSSSSVSPFSARSAAARTAAISSRSGNRFGSIRASLVRAANAEPAAAAPAVRWPRRERLVVRDRGGTSVVSQRARAPPPRASAAASSPERVPGAWRSPATRWASSRSSRASAARRTFRPPRRVSELAVSCTSAPSATAGSSCSGETCTDLAALRVGQHGRDPSLAQRLDGGLEAQRPALVRELEQQIVRVAGQPEPTALVAARAAAGSPARSRPRRAAPARCRPSAARPASPGAGAPSSPAWSGSPPERAGSRPPARRPSRLRRARSPGCRRACALHRRRREGCASAGRSRAPSVGATRSRVSGGSG